MSPYHHSIIHAKKYGGIPEDYNFLDTFIDSSKSHYANVKHRALLHSSFGIHMAEVAFGLTFKNSDGRIVNVREVVMDHIMQDLGFIPTVENYLDNLTLQPWMSGTEKGKKIMKNKTINIELKDL